MRRVLTSDEQKRVEYLIYWIARSDASESDLMAAISIENWYRGDGKLSDAQIDLLEAINKRAS
jgi:hypothetical protein